MYKISIIIPAYNAEMYLSKLMDSILNQTINFKNLEVIIIDDCSTDTTRKQIENYERKYENVKGIYLPQNNEIAGKARNEGVKIATGKYLMFADSDDCYTLDACEVLYNAMEEKEADFITANYINMDADGTIWNKPIFDLEKYDNFRLSISDYDKSFFILNSSVCNKIFKRSFVKEHEIKFLEGVPGEDAYFTTSCFMKANKVYYLKNIMYCYRQRNKDSVNKSVSFSLSRKYFEKINRSYRAIYENFKKNNFLKFYRYTYAKNMSYMLYKFIDSNRLTREERMEIIKEMRWFYELSVTLKVPPCQKAQKMILTKIIEKDYEEAINYCEIVADIRSYLPKELREDMSRPDSDMYKEIGKYDNEF